MRLHLPLLCALLAGPALGQVQGVDPVDAFLPEPEGGHAAFKGKAKDIDLIDTALATVALLGRALPGNFTDDAMMDAVVMVGEAPHAVSGPSLYQATQMLGRSVTDITVLEGMGQDGRDAFALINSRGLYVGYWDFASESFVSQSIAGGAWTDMELLRAADLDGSGRMDLVGLLDDGETIMTLFAEPTGLTFSPGPSFTLAGAGIVEVRPLQWLEGGDMELAFLTSFGLEVYDLLGTQQLFSQAGVETGDVLVALREARHAYDRLVWITTLDPDIGQLLFAADAVGGLEDPIDLGLIEAVSAATADYDLDGDDDLYFLHRFNHQGVLLFNQRTDGEPLATTFDPLAPGGVLLVDIGPENQSNPTQEGWPVFRDLDNDGDPDLFTPVQSTGKVVLSFNDTIDETDFMPTVRPSGFEVLDTNTPAEATVGLTAPLAQSSEATHIELAIWQQKGLRGLNDGDSVDHIFFPLTGWPQEISFNLPQTTHIFSEIYNFELRLVELGTGGVVLESWPGQLTAFTLSQFVADEIEEKPGTGSFSPITLTGHAEGVGIDASTLAGGIGRIPSAAFKALPKKKAAGSS